MTTSVEPPRAPESTQPLPVKTALWKRWWFWVAVVVVLGIGGLFSSGGEQPTATSPAAPASATQMQTTQTSVEPSRTVAQTTGAPTTAAATPTPPATTKAKVDLAARVAAAIGIGGNQEPTWAMPITKIEAMGSDGIRVSYQESLTEDEKVMLGQGIFNFIRASDIKLDTIVVTDVSGVDFNVYCGKTKCAHNRLDIDY